MKASGKTTKEMTAVAELAFELRETLGRAARLIRIEAGPPLTQLSVLGDLQRKGAMSTNELAAAERVRPQSMTVIVRALEESGLIKRTPHPTDRRQILIELTEKGQGTLENIFAQREDWLTDVMLQILTNEERKELQQGLALIQKIIKTRE